MDNMEYNICTKCHKTSSVSSSNKYYCGEDGGKLIEYHAKCECGAIIIPWSSPIWHKYICFPKIWHTIYRPEPLYDYCRNCGRKTKPQLQQYLSDFNNESQELERVNP